jgi:two-component system chemotaxis response regulator CheB
MDALPPDLGPSETRTTGLTCPECPGVLEMSVLGDGGALHFRCRIGHTYAFGELVAAKEELIERWLWSAVTAFDELAQLLEDAARYATRYGEAWLAGPHDERVARCRRQAAALRDLIRSDRPAILAHPSEDGGA